MVRRHTYSAIVIFLTLISVSMMLYTYKGGFAMSSEYEPQSSYYTDYHDREYLGYIFNDYNKTVNLSYTDKVFKASDDKNSKDAMSLSSLGFENTRDNVRLVNSEREIEKRAVKDEMLKNCIVDTMAVFRVSDFDSRIELNDKIELLNLMRNLNNYEMVQMKSLFDKPANEIQSKNTLSMLNNKLPKDEYTKLLSLVTKYK